MRKCETGINMYTLQCFAQTVICDWSGHVVDYCNTCPYNYQASLRRIHLNKGRGRPYRIDPAIVVGAADAYRTWFQQFWAKLGPRILTAKSSEEITRAITEDAPSVSTSLIPLSELILKIVRDTKFPRVRAASQIHFLADSLGGQGFVEPRRSREICAEERSKERHVIVRREFYIECSCGYQGPARDGACAKCGTAELSSELKMKEEY
jgi:hypothetical protein